MRRFPRLRAAAACVVWAAFCAPALAAEPAPPGAVRPPQDAVSFAYFQQRLTVFGHWIRHPVWGDVWQPDAGANFRPYFYGYWQYTSDYGWLWVSNEPYGDIVYHYGRWAYDPNFGWLWVPGYIWGPSWVVWRESEGYIGWLAMPPGYDVVAGYQDFSGYTPPAPAYAPENLYGYQNFYSGFPLDAFLGLWVFAPNQDFGRSDKRSYVVDKEKLRQLYRGSHDSTHYVHDRSRDRVVDHSIDKNALEQSTHRNFGAADGRQFLRRDTPMTSVSEGQDVARRESQREFSRRIPEPALSGPAQSGVGRGFTGRLPPRDAQASGPPAATPANLGAIGNDPETALRRAEPGLTPRGGTRGFGGRFGAGAPAVIAPSTDGSGGVPGGMTTQGIAPANVTPMAQRALGRMPASPAYSLPQGNPGPNPGAVISGRLQPPSVPSMPVLPSAPASPPVTVAPPAAAPPPLAGLQTSVPGGGDQGAASGRGLRGFSGRTGL